MNRGSSGDVAMDMRTFKAWVLLLYIAIITTLTLLAVVFGIPFVDGA